MFGVENGRSASSADCTAERSFRKVLYFEKSSKEIKITFKDQRWRMVKLQLLPRNDDCCFEQGETLHLLSSSRVNDSFLGVHSSISNQKFVPKVE